MAHLPADDAHPPMTPADAAARQVEFWRERALLAEERLAQAHQRADTLADWYDVAVRAWSRVRQVASSHGTVCELPELALPGEVYLCPACQVAWVASLREPGAWEMQAEAAFAQLRNPDGTAPAAGPAAADDAELDVVAKQAVEALLRTLRHD